jgi:Trk K+ transport system NAD-binding subunit
MGYHPDMVENRTKRGLVVGFGMPGRAAADKLLAAGYAVTVIELNADTAARCERPGLHFIHGDASDPAVLQQVDLPRCDIAVVAVPADPAAIMITRALRQLNAVLPIFARCHYTSTGLELRKSGAAQVYVAEQLMARQISDHLPV